MQLQANTYYKTRDGRKAFVGHHNPKRSDPWIGYVESNAMVYAWSDNGMYLPGNTTCDSDLISEWTEPAVGSYEWAMALPVGTKIRWESWIDRNWYVQRTPSGWRVSCPDLVPPSVGVIAGWLLYTEPKLRPWRMDEVPLGAWLTMDEKPGRYLITGAREFYIIIVSESGAISYEQAFNRCKHSTDGGKTWRPCGVEE